MRVKIPSLTLITDSSRYPDDLLFSVLEKTLSHGVDAVLLREKQLSSAKLLALASRLRELTSAYEAAFYIHTQADIAVAVDADGVHLASGDMSNIPGIRGWLNDANKTVSVSCHSLTEIRMAEQHGADFLFLSPVFPTASHPGAAHLGADTFIDLAAQSSLPVLALGGIDEENCQEIRGHGIAVISALLAADDPAVTATRLYQQRSPG